jgi:hypothetical protein
VCSSDLSALMTICARPIPGKGKRGKPIFRIAFFDQSQKSDVAGI